MKFEYTKNLIIKLMKHEWDVNYDIARIWIKYLENKKSEDFSETWARVYTSNEIEKVLIELNLSQEEIDRAMVSRKLKKDEH